MRTKDRAQTNERRQSLARRLHAKEPMRLALLCAVVLASACKKDDSDANNVGECAVETVATPQVVRLTHLQYDNAVQDLFGLDLTPSDSFLDDPVFGGFDNNAEALQTTERLANDYQRAAELVAAAAVAEPEVMDRIVPCDEETIGCASDFARQFGKKIYRRPLTSDEVDRYQAIYTAAEGLYETGTPFEQGIQLMIEGMLQSPNFLYRLEGTTEGSNNTPGQHALNDYEVATRLAFMLWNAPPDTTLLNAARDGELSTAAGIAAQAERMLDDHRAESVVDDFHYQLLDMGHYLDLTRSPDLYPDFDPSMGYAMIEEAQSIARYHTLYSDGTFEDLMTAPVTYANADLARIYGLDPAGFDDELVLTDLNPSERGGLLTLSGFLASHAYYDMSSPIHRGVFIHRNLLCTDIPDPPGDADLELPEIDGATTREIVEQHTSPAGCDTCHSLINGPGFAFENYDAIGQYRTEENGHPIDASATTPLPTGETLEFDDGIELSKVIADSPTARRCYLNQWFRYTNARIETEVDTCQLDSLEAQLADPETTIAEIVLALTTSPSARTRTQGVSQ